MLRTGLALELCFSNPVDVPPDIVMVRYVVLVPAGKNARGLEAPSKGVQKPLRSQKKEQEKEKEKKRKKKI